MYVITDKLAEQIASFARRMTPGAAGSRQHGDACEILGALACMEQLSDDRVREVAHWAREQSRTLRDEVSNDECRLIEPEHVRRIFADCARIQECCDDILQTLACSELPAGAMTTIGDARTQVPILWDHLTMGKHREGAGPAPEYSLADFAQAEVAVDRFVQARGFTVDRGFTVEVEPAANGRVSRAQVEGLPSAESVALAQILALVEDRQLTGAALDGPACDVVVAVSAYIERHEAKP